MLQERPTVEATQDELREFGYRNDSRLEALKRENALRLRKAREEFFEEFQDLYIWAMAELSQDDAPFSAGF